MGGGDDNKVEETEYEKASADIANKYWDIYQKDLKQYEDVFIQRVDNLNSDSNMANVKADTDLAYNSAFSENRDATAKHLTASGINPSSKKFGSAMADLSTAQATHQADTVNRAQAAGQDAHIAGLSDVVAMGLGEQAEALQRSTDVARMSLREAQQDAQVDFNRRSGNLQTAGAVAGIGLRSAQQFVGRGTGSSNLIDGSSTSRQGRYDPNFNPDGAMHA
ncbi:hypothetical protein [Grimontia marina]|uniref:Uncharacterized protein n=1 Tax=Grimontia marina TaxID=646534 RepID=A0A128EYU6_9GAMM|nr:hypothetical protein [Grimontia marina]CZF79743.1 hypothetical protein GMA8713_01111 [Grimontia marina]